MTTAAICEQCRQPGARTYEQYAHTAPGEPAVIQQAALCAKCARQLRTRQALAPLDLPNALTRAELIATVDRFWRESGAGEICGRCHAQGTGCCPPMCRYLGAEGCLRKNVFCTGFVCSALLNAIAECDAEIARCLKWIKTQVGTAEFRLYEMVTRVPAVDREQVRPLSLPTQYPGPLPLNGETIREKLHLLTAEVLEIRRHWHEEELRQILDIKQSENQCTK